MFEKEQFGKQKYKTFEPIIIHNKLKKSKKMSRLFGLFGSKLYLCTDF